MPRRTHSAVQPGHNPHRPIRRRHVHLLRHPHSPPPTSTHYRCQSTFPNPANLLGGGMARSGDACVSVACSAGPRRERRRGPATRRSDVRRCPSGSAASESAAGPGQRAARAGEPGTDRRRRAGLTPVCLDDQRDAATAALIAGTGQGGRVSGRQPWRELLRRLTGGRWPPIGGRSCHGWTRRGRTPSRRSGPAGGRARRTCAPARASTATSSSSRSTTRCASGADGVVGAALHPGAVPAAWPAAAGLAALRTENPGYRFRMP